MSTPAGQVFEFAEFRLTAGERLLLRNGSAVPLTPKAFETLLVLVQNNGHVVTRDELLEAVWHDSFVEENTLTQNVAALRKALGEGQNGHQYIETVPKVGYRFVVRVRELGQQSSGVVAERRVRERVVIKAQKAAAYDEATDDHAFSQAPLAVFKAAKKYRGLSIAVVALVLIGIAAVVLLANRSNPASLGSPIKSIAVLPFKSLSAEGSDEYLGVGLADALTTRLGKFKQLIVRPTNAVYKYRQVGQDPVAAGRELRVEAVLDGTIQRSGDRVRVTLQMVPVPGSSPIWTETFDEKFTDIFILQDQVANRVAGAITSELTGNNKDLAKRPTESTEAYQAYLKGRFFWNKWTEEGTRKAIEYFEEATRIDPNFALAYAGLAHCYNSLGNNGAILGALLPRQVYPKAKAAALRALELDEGLGEAYASLALVKWNYDWDWAGAESDFKLSIELDPNFASAHHAYAIILGQMGKLDQATAEIKRAQELDPVSATISTSLGWVFYWRREYDQAIEQCRKALELDQNFARAYVIAGRAYSKKAMHREAIAELERAGSVSGNRPHAIATLGLAYAAAGRRTEALKVLDDLKELSKQHYVSPYHIAAIHANLDQSDQAFAFLEKAWEDRTVPMIEIKGDPSFDTLRSDPRFRRLLNRLGAAE